MKITIDIPDEEIREAVKNIIAHEIHKSGYVSMESRNFRKVYGDIIREMIYEPKLKAEIIDKTVKLAAHEIRRKGMPILANKLLEGNNDD